MQRDFTHMTTRDHFVTADKEDPLAHFRQLFDLPENVIYLDGNSLGAMPKEAVSRANHVLRQEWGNDLIGSWNTHHWFELPQRIGGKISQLIGGSAGSCVATDTTSINIFKTLASAVHIQAETQPNRRVIVTERENFPTDIYIVEGLIEFLGAPQGHQYELVLVDDAADLEQLVRSRGEEIVCALITHVNYRSGYMWDLSATTQMVQQCGALMIWDLCHSAGAVEVDLSSAHADFAVGCTYKYLNGGPGSPAYVWCADRHLENITQPMTGWWSHRTPFAMQTHYVKTTKADQFLVGTQPILSLATMEIGIDIALSVDQSTLREKSLALTSLFIQLVESRLGHHELTLMTPLDETHRGSHVSFSHEHAYPIIAALISLGVIGDYREPGVMRFGFAPLYNGFTDVWDAVETLRRVLDEELYRAPEFQIRGAVT